jgi:hypothetical protein
MNRRKFLETSTGAAALLAALPHPTTGNDLIRSAAQKARELSLNRRTYAGFTLKELRDQYRGYLFADFLPFMD